MTIGRSHTIAIAFAFWMVGFAHANGEARQHLVPMFPAYVDQFHSGIVRLINHSSRSGEIQIVAVDAGGSRFGPITLTIEADEAVQFNSEDLENGNAAKGLSSGTGSGEGDWVLWLSTGLDIEVLSYIRTATDGILTAMHDLAPIGEDGRHRVAFFNPASNVGRASRLRLINPGEESARVTIEGIDKSGESASGIVRLTVPAGAARTLDARELESGDTGFQGALGDGAGKWRLMVGADKPIHVMSLLSSRNGHLSNLSTVPANLEGGVRTLPMFPAASDPLGREGVVRVINHSDEAGVVTIDAFDDSGRAAAPLTLALGAGETVQFNSHDLEMGNPGKGIAGGTGEGDGHWRLALSSNLNIEVLAYIRMVGGFLTAMHDTVPREGTRHRVATFNPGSNASQVSWLRLVNAGSETAEVVITGIDSRGERSWGNVSVSVPAGTTRTLAAHKLEVGGDGFEGEIGDGEGKWQLVVESQQPILVLSLLSSPMGHVTNLSTWPTADFAPADSLMFNDRVLGKRVVGDDPASHFGFLADGRFRRTEGSQTYYGSYAYMRKGPNEATVVYHYDNGDHCTTEFTFLSRTAGIASYVCTTGDSGELDWHIVDSPTSSAEPAPDLMVKSVSASDTRVAAGASFTLIAVVHNAGSQTSPATTVRYYRSWNRTVSTADAALGSKEVMQLAVAGESEQSLYMTAPTVPGTYYFGACIERVAGESNIENNCSNGVQVTVTGVLAGQPVTIPDVNLRTVVEHHLGKASGDSISVEEMATLTTIVAHGLYDSGGISDLEGIQFANNLEELDIGNYYWNEANAEWINLNEVADLTPLAGLTKLARLNLSGSNARIRDLSPISRLTNLEEFRCWNCNVTDLSPLSRLSKLSVLYLGSNDWLSDLTPLSGLRNLVQLIAYYCNISDVAPLSDLTNLEVLNLLANNISDVSALSRLGKLHHLDVSFGEISDISHLSDLTKLQSLGLAGNDITDISPLSELSELHWLNLDGNDISDISALSALTELIDLNLDDVGLTNLSPIRGLKQLFNLSLKGNKIADVSALTELINLYTLDLRENNISDVEPLVENTGLGGGDIVDLRDNPLNKMSINDYIPALVARGIDVSYSEVLATVDDPPMLFNDNVFVLPVSEDLAADVLPLNQFAIEFYKHFEDEFDFLFLLPNLDVGEDVVRDYLAAHFLVGNDVNGIGLQVFFDNTWGSAGRLQSVLHFVYYYGMSSGPTLHEVMHQWANFIVDDYSPHWGFTSANGNLGGFDSSDLVDHGGGQYTAGDFTLGGYTDNLEPFSLIELYLSGFVAPEDVPDLLVAENAEALLNEEGNIVIAENGYPVFTADRISTLTIEDIVATHGERVPKVTEARKDFRAAAVLLIDKNNPATKERLEFVSEGVSWFSRPAADEYDRTYNFYEATGRRGTMTMDSLSEFATAAGHTLRKVFGAVSPAVKDLVRANERSERLRGRKGSLLSDVGEVRHELWSHGHDGIRKGVALE